MGVRTCDGIPSVTVRGIPVACKPMRCARRCVIAQYCWTYPSGKPATCSTVAGHPAHMERNRHDAQGCPSGNFFVTFPPIIAHTSSKGCSNRFPTACRDDKQVLTPPCTFTARTMRPPPHRYTSLLGSLENRL